jgi:hypothetical protein
MPKKVYWPAVFLGVIATAPAFGQQPEPDKPEGWIARVMLVRESEFHQLHLSVKSSLGQCMDTIRGFADKTEKRNGALWTDKDYLAYGDKGDFTNVEHKVIGITCDFRHCPAGDPHCMIPPDP